MIREAGLAGQIHRMLQSAPGAEVTYLDRRGRSQGTLAPDRLLSEALLRARAIETRVSAGSLVLLVMPPGPEFLLSLLGCFLAGVIVVPVPDPGLSGSLQRLNGIVADARPAGILCSRSNRQVLEEQFSGNAPAVLVMEDLSAEADDRSPVCAGLHQSGQETVLIQYTSGSTRHPRGVALSGNNILCNAALVRDHWGLSPEKDLLVNWLPHHHDMGLMGGLLYPLLMGGPSVQMSPMAFMQHPGNWLKTISQVRGTVSGGPAFAFSLCLETMSEEQIGELDLSCWTTAFCGAEPVPASLLCRFRQRFARVGLAPRSVFASYGLAEATLLVAGFPAPADSPSQHNDGARLEAARLSPQMRKMVCIVDPKTGLQAADGHPGEIWVRGPSVAHGYLRQDTLHPESLHPDPLDPDQHLPLADPFCATLPDSAETFLRTGDLGWIGPSGLHISGRQKDVLIANGANIAAVDVEWMAAELDPRLNPLAAAAVSITQDGPDEAALVMELKTDRAAIVEPEQLAANIRRTIRGAYGIDLHHVVFVKRGSLERTTSGKVRRQAVADRLRAGHVYPEAGA